MSSRSSKPAELPVGSAQADSGMTNGCTITSLAVLRGGLAVFVLALLTGMGLLLRYFYVTPFVICIASLANTSVTAVWPWALPLLTAAAAALTLAAFALLALARARKQGPSIAHEGNMT
jgi:hypothetical protein